MNHLFPPLLPKDPLRAPVLVLAAHPDDEVIGAGSMLAWHRARGHRVVVAHLTDGAKGDPDNREDDIREVRRREGRAALEVLGVEELLHFDLPDGELPEHQEQCDLAVSSLIDDIQPKTLYSFFYFEAHRDHRAVAASIVRNAQRLPEDCRCLLFGVNHVVPGGVLFDTTDFVEQKQQALSCFESQIAYLDWRSKIRGRDHAATVNVDIRGVEYAEYYADLRPNELEQMQEACKQVFPAVMRGEDG
ncbi:MAG: PIG-L deacetylase family protein [Planctomycetota bacterium]